MHAVKGVADTVGLGWTGSAISERFCNGYVRYAATKKIGDPFPQHCFSLGVLIYLAKQTVVCQALGFGAVGDV